MAWAEDRQQIDSIAGERRLDRRYPIQLDLRWKLIRRKKIQDTGTGRTMDLSSGGILFQPGRPLPVGLNVELAISWPIRLHDVAPLQLVVSARIVRSTGGQTAVQIVQHEFRTAGISPDSSRDLVNQSSRTAGLLFLATGGGIRQH